MRKMRLTAICLLCCHLVLACKAKDSALPSVSETPKAKTGEACISNVDGNSYKPSSPASLGTSIAGEPWQLVDGAAGIQEHKDVARYLAMFLSKDPQGFRCGLSGLIHNGARCGGYGMIEVAVPAKVGVYTEQDRVKDYRVFVNMYARETKHGVNFSKWQVEVTSITPKTISGNITFTWDEAPAGTLSGSFTLPVCESIARFEYSLKAKDN